MIDKSEMEVLRGERAALLLQEPLLIEAFQLIESELMDKWHKTSPREAADRESLYLQVKSLREVQAKLYQVVETGKVAKARLFGLMPSRSS